MIRSATMTNMEYGHAPPHVIVTLKIAKTPAVSKIANQYVDNPKLGLNNNQIVYEDCR